MGTQTFEEFISEQQCKTIMKQYEDALQVLGEKLLELQRRLQIQESSMLSPSRHAAVNPIEEVGSPLGGSARLHLGMTQLSERLIQLNPCRNQVQSASSDASPDYDIWEEYGEPENFLRASLSQVEDDALALSGLRKQRQQFQVVLKGTQQSMPASRHRSWLFRLYLEMGTVVQDLERGLSLQNALGEMEVRMLDSRARRMVP